MVLDIRLKLNITLGLPSVEHTSLRQEMEVGLMPAFISIFADYILYRLMED